MWVILSCFEEGTMYGSSAFCYGEIFFSRRAIRLVNVFTKTKFYKYTYSLNKFQNEIYYRYEICSLLKKVSVFRILKEKYNNRDK